MNDDDARNDFDGTQVEFLEHVVANLIIGIEYEIHPPVPVFPYIKPTMGVQFLLHNMLSMGRFETKIDLNTHTALQDSLHYAKPIGTYNDTNDLVG